MANFDPAAESQRHRLIGGVLGLPEAAAPAGAAAGDWLFQKPSAVRTANARSAFFLLGQSLRPRKAWLPSFLCDTVVVGFRAAGVEVEFFPVGEDLAGEGDDWLQRVAPGDIVLRIHYFGFRNEDPIYPAAVARGACLVDDAAPALLTTGLGAGAHAIVYSARKFVGVPDGGILVPLATPSAAWPALARPAAAWWLEAFLATQERRDFDRGRGQRDWFARFQRAERSAPAGAVAMSDLSSHLLDHAFDFAAIAARRRENYRVLARRLGEFALFPALPDGVAPIGFPLRIAQRDAVRKALFAADIFPPVHWPIAGLVPDEFRASHRLAGEIMTLPCDQRYDAADMMRMCDALLASPAR